MRLPLLLPLALLLPAFGQSGLERAREVNLARAASLPNFVADEVVNFYAGDDDGDALSWRHRMTVESEITVRGVNISRQHWRKDGKPLAKPMAVVGGGFGSELLPLFRSGCPTQIEPESSAQGKSWYRFSAPENTCFPAVGPDFSHMYNAARSGRFLIDDRNGSLIQFEVSAIGFPADFPFAERHEVERWDYIEISGASHLLPVSAEFSWRFLDQPPERATVAYKNHRHFEASSNLSFK